MKRVVTSIIIVFAGALLSTWGDVLLKQSALRRFPILLLGIVLYACGAIPVAIAFTEVPFGTVFIVWESLTVLTALIIARVLFHEPITPARLAAFGLSIAALLLSYR